MLWLPTMLARPGYLAAAAPPFARAWPRACYTDSSPSKAGLCIVDVSNIMYRMHFAMPPLTSPSGEPVHAVLGFCNKLLQLREVFPDHHFVAAFDGGRCDFRTEMLASYKATRKAMPPDLRRQFDLAREATSAFGVPALSEPGYEADDVIATCVAAARADGLAAVAIVTSDKDMMQLVSTDDGEATNVTVFDDKKKRLMDHREVVAAFGVGPHQFIDYLSLTGDTSDCVPGIPGVGPKTAASLLLKHGDLDGVLEAAATTMAKSKRREALREYSEQARLAKRLVTLHAQVPLDVQLVGGSALGLPPSESGALRPFLQRLGFARHAAPRPRPRTEPVSSRVYSGRERRFQSARLLTDVPFLLHRLEQKLYSKRPLSTRSKAASKAATASPTNEPLRVIQSVAEVQQMTMSDVDIPF